MKKHYGHFLSWAGNPVKYQSQDIETLLIKKERLEKELRELEQLIKKRKRILPYTYLKNGLMKKFKKLKKKHIKAVIKKSQN